MVVSARAKIALAVVLLVAASGVWGTRLVRWLHAKHGQTAVFAVGGKKLEATIVTPHLQCSIGDGKNIVWCATFQLAWNELCDLLGGPIEPDGASEEAAILNERTVTRADVDEAHCVALAGYPTGGPDDILNKIADAMDRTFAGTARPHYLPERSSLEPEDWVAYAYLFKELSFQSPFQRMPSGLTFGDREVQHFGIKGLSQSQPDQVKAAAQVSVYDYRGADDFIIELKTRSPSDRMILAKVTPEPTLAETIQAVQRRMTQSRPAGMRRTSHLFIPLVDFDLCRRYIELEQGGIALQQIAFKLNESGIVIQSEASTVRNGHQHLIFDKPFLIMLRKTNARNPYFALWIANAELLVPLAE
jgi:hypothetical protein